MNRCLIKIKNKYFEWSSVVDAPTSDGMSREELDDFVKTRHGKNEAEHLDEVLKLVDELGTSIEGVGVAELISGNRAGDNEEELTMEEIYKAYTE
jgi:pyrroloquinoline quinone (PQQ) biosynthesis protein C